MPLDSERSCGLFLGKLINNIEFVVKLSLLPVTLDRNRLYWEVTVPLRPTGRKQVRFKRKWEAEKYFRACAIELRRTRRVEFFSNRNALVDALEAYRMLRGVGDRKKLRRAAAILLECEVGIGKLGREELGAYTEPASRGIELTPGLYVILNGMARRKGMALSDLVNGALWRYVKEATAPSSEEVEVGYMRDCLRGAA